jgi:zinc protease
MHFKATTALLIAGLLIGAGCSSATRKTDSVKEPTVEATVGRGIPAYRPLSLRKDQVEVVDLGEFEGVRGWRIGDIEVLHKQTPANAVVSAQLYIRGGTLNLDEERAGIEQLALGVAVHGGTASTSKDELSARLDAVGSSLGQFVDRDYSAVSMLSVVEHFDVTWDLFVETVLEPAFPGDEIELQRTRQIQQIRSIFDSPDSHVSYAATRLLFQGHPYYHLHMGTEDNVAAFTREELKAYQRSLIAPERLLLVVVGNIAHDHLVDKVKASFGRLEAGGRDRLVAPPLEVSGNRQAVEQRELPTNYIFGLFPAPSMDHDDYAPMVVATQHLRDRLFEEVRTRRNLTYAVSAGLSNKKANYGFLYVTAVDPGATMPVIFEEVERLKSSPLSGDELDEVRNVFLTSHYMDLQTNASQAAALAEAAIIGGDWRLGERFLERVQAVTPEDIQRVASRYFHNYHFAIIGNPEVVDGPMFGME